MNIVKFPFFNLEFSFSKIAFWIFGMPIYKYAICIVLGICIALIFARISKEKFDIEYDFVLENTIFALIFGIIGARIYYVIFNLNYYFNGHLNEILNLQKRWSCYIWRINFWNNFYNN